MNPTQTVEKEEDLLILNDDVRTDALEPTETLVFDEAPNEENIISFDEAIEEMKTPTPVVSEDTTGTPEENTLDLSSLSEEVSSSDSVTTEPEAAVASEDAFDFGSFGSGEETKKDEGTMGDDMTASISSDADDVNSILDEAIHKLQARKESIVSEQSKKEQHISDLQAQISGLEEEVAGEESGVKDLVTESKKIEENVAQLEKMKLTEDTVKEHNTKRSHKA